MMTSDMLAQLKRSLVQHEGYHNYVYTDTVGKITIGIGYNLTDRGLPDSWINQQFIDDVSYFYNRWFEFPWYRLLNPARQIVLLDFAFMGWQKVLEFKDLLAALAAKDYDKAADAMLDSKWAQQVGKRSQDLADGLRNGVYEL